MTVSASTVGEALEVLFEQHSSLRDSLIPKSGDIFEAVNPVSYTHLTLPTIYSV